MYQDQCRSAGVRSVCYSKYREVFRSKNLAIHKPKKDQCKTCNMFVVEINKRFLIFKLHLSSNRPETSPNRKRIREDVHNNIKINAERMKRRYCKKMELLFIVFIEGDKVAVQIPQKDRGKTDMRRIPAIIVKLSRSTPPCYKLACEYGTIEGYYSASDIIPYPSCVCIDKSEEDISLREAVVHAGNRSCFVTRDVTQVKSVTTQTLLVLIFHVCFFLITEECLGQRISPTLVWLITGWQC